jgi:hypothetical protein
VAADPNAESLQVDPELYQQQPAGQQAQLQRASGSAGRQVSAESPLEEWRGAAGSPHEEWRSGNAARGQVALSSFTNHGEILSSHKAFMMVLPLLLLTRQ